MSKDFEDMLKSSLQISSSTEQLLLRERLKHTIDYYFQTIPCVPIEERLLLEALLNIVSSFSQKELGDYFTSDAKKEYIDKIREKTLHILKRFTTSQALSVFSVEEAVNIALKLGIDKKPFSLNTIGELLGLEEEKIKKITKEELLIYKDNINKILDNFIGIVTEQEEQSSVKFSMKPSSS